MRDQSGTTNPQGLTYEDGQKAMQERAAQLAFARFSSEVGHAIRALAIEAAPVPKLTGCRRKLAAGQWWGFCGETDMGQTMPVLCTECGGNYKLEDVQT